MPELPDVEVFRRELERNALRQSIETVEVRAPRLLARLSPGQLRAKLLGAKLRATCRYGKRLYCALDSGEWLSMHFGLSGALDISARTEKEPDFARVIIGLADGKRLSYTNRRMIGRVELVATPEADVHDKHLGPDALDPAFTLGAFREALAGRKAAMKNVLMDQAVLAGIGNAYSDEILFQARLHPGVSATDLDSKAVSALYKTLRQVLRRAIASNADPRNLPPGFLIPRRRDGAPCPRCGGRVQRYRVGERNGYFCPRCQRLSPRSQ